MTDMKSGKRNQKCRISYFGACRLQLPAIVVLMIVFDAKIHFISIFDLANEKNECPGL